MLTISQRIGSISVIEFALERGRLTLDEVTPGVGCGEDPALARATRPVPGHRNGGARGLLDSARCLGMASTSPDIEDVSLHVKPQTHSSMIDGDTSFPSQPIEMSSQTDFLSSATETSITPVDMAITADDKPHNVKLNEQMPMDPTSTGTSQLAQLANQEDHEVGKLASFHKYPGLAFGVYMQCGSSFLSASRTRQLVLSLGYLSSAKTSVMPPQLQMAL